MCIKKNSSCRHWQSVRAESLLLLYGRGTVKKRNERKKMKKYQQAMALLARFPLWKGKAKETEMHVKKKSPFSNASIPVEPKNMSHILERKKKKR
jgi:hypothetical protein